MARGKGTANLAASLEVLAGAPLDARLVCPTVADLYIASNWPYKYIGMKTTVQSTGDTYRLINLDVTQESSWVKEGATEYDDFTGATLQAAGVHGLVPAPAISDMEKFLKGDGTWGVVPIPSFDYSNTSPDAMNFSADEKVIGTWVDGKPLYQKVISTTLPEVTTDGQNNSKLVSIGASIDVGFIAAAFFKSINNNYNPIVFVSSAINRMVNAVVYPNDGIGYQNALNMNCNSIGYSEEPVCFIVHYTKTTDSPVASGEKIVGQWIDGRIVFEKIIALDTELRIETSQAWVNTNINIPNCEQIIHADFLDAQGSNFLLSTSISVDSYLYVMNYRNEHVKFKYVVCRYIKVS